MFFKFSLTNKTFGNIYSLEEENLRDFETIVLNDEESKAGLKCLMLSTCIHVQSSVLQA